MRRSLRIWKKLILLRRVSDRLRGTLTITAQLRQRRLLRSVLDAFMELSDRFGQIASAG